MPKRQRKEDDCDGDGDGDGRDVGDQAGNPSNPQRPKRPSLRQEGRRAGGIARGRGSGESLPSQSDKGNDRWVQQNGVLAGRGVHQNCRLTSDYQSISGWMVREIRDSARRLGEKRKVDGRYGDERLNRWMAVRAGDVEMEKKREEEKEKKKNGGKSDEHCGCVDKAWFEGEVEKLKAMFDEVMEEEKKTRGRTGKNRPVDSVSKESQVMKDGGGARSGNSGSKTLGGGGNTSAAPEGGQSPTLPLLAKEFEHLRISDAQTGSQPPTNRSKYPETPATGIGTAPRKPGTSPTHLAAKKPRPGPTPGQRPASSPSPSPSSGSSPRLPPLPPPRVPIPSPETPLYPPVPQLSRRPGPRPNSSHHRGFSSTLPQQSHRPSNDSPNVPSIATAPPSSRPSSASPPSSPPIPVPLPPIPASNPACPDCKNLADRLQQVQQDRQVEQQQWKSKREHLEKMLATMMARDLETGLLKRQVKNLQQQLQGQEGEQQKLERQKRDEENKRIRRDSEEWGKKLASSSSRRPVRSSSDSTRGAIGRRILVSAAPIPNPTSPPPASVTTPPATSNPTSTPVDPAVTPAATSAATPAHAATPTATPTAASAGMGAGVNSSKTRDSNERARPRSRSKSPRSPATTISGWNYETQLPSVPSLPTLPRRPLLPTESTSPGGDPGPNVKNNHSFRVFGNEEEISGLFSAIEKGGGTGAGSSAGSSSNPSTTTSSSSSSNPKELDNLRQELAYQREVNEITTDSLLSQHDIANQIRRTAHTSSFRFLYSPPFTAVHFHIYIGVSTSTHFPCHILFLLLLLLLLLLGTSSSTPVPVPRTTPPPGTRHNNVHNPPRIAQPAPGKNHILSPVKAQEIPLGEPNSSIVLPKHPNVPSTSSPAGTIFRRATSAMRFGGAAAAAATMNLNGTGGTSGATTAMLTQKRAQRRAERSKREPHRARELEVRNSPGRSERARGAGAAEAAARRGGGEGGGGSRRGKGKGKGKRKREGGGGGGGGEKKTEDKDEWFENLRDVSDDDDGDDDDDDDDDDDENDNDAEARRDAGAPGIYRLRMMMNNPNNLHGYLGHDASLMLSPPLGPSHWHYVAAQSKRETSLMKRNGGYHIIRKEAK
ncbi:hypothetical protein MKZ38_005216 [Zalerion maritima]|uniref:Uncharacterized protein n=1 Tax=Zalerion maritima TaxID=339359 RepID=A0AAD5WP39_9PEZI|nr:hypothetical protein MKZ38_005216 [Zalerion maritima]